MKIYLLPLLFLPHLALAAPSAERQPYTCDNGSHIELSLTPLADGRPGAMLHFADGTVSLPQVPAASGALYRADEIRLHLKGDEALFEDGKGNTRRCALGNIAPASSQAVPAAASSFIDISGSVSYLTRIALPPDALLIVRVQDTARAGAPARTLAEQRIELAGQQVPIHVKATVDRDLIGKKARVTVSARIERQGKLLFISEKTNPALKNGQPIPVEIVLKQVARKTR